MTENEAIKVLEKPSKHIRMVHKTKNEMEFYTFSSDLVKAFEMAIQALEEMQKIKALGDCYIIPKNSTWEVNGIDIHKALEEIQQYRAIGTVEEFKALKNIGELEYSRGYNKAIDEFVIKLKRVRGYGLITNFDRPFGVTFNKLDEIAEEMKGGAE